MRQCVPSILATALLAFALSGCSANRHKVIAATATVIGLEIAQNPANQSPQVKLGYNRAELAIVPTNRADNIESGTQGSGATDVADVLMELKYQGLFGGENSGIYQRLAVGTTAVEQPGAWLMFLKDNSGTVSAENAAALDKLLDGIEELRTKPAVADLARVYARSADPTQFDAVAKNQGFVDFGSFLGSAPSDEQITSMTQALQAQGLM